MKLVSLNTWGGKVFEPFMDFIRKQSKDTDVFCLQEIYSTKSDITNYHDIRANLLDELKKILPDFRSFYSTEMTGYDSCPDPTDFDLTVGKVIFIRKNIDIINTRELLIYGKKDEKFLKKDFSNLPITLQCVYFNADGKLFSICNFHGTSFPGSKLDTAVRLKQSEKLVNFLKTIRCAKILTGDFNLLPSTESIKMVEEILRNLIKEFNITRTRSSLSPFAGKPDFQKYADYIFVSNDVNVKNFEVPALDISDHLPMILEFS